jgi:hypothetical protein
MEDASEKSRPAWVIERFGGPGRDRTDDLFHAMEARSQLRHRPTIEAEKPKPDASGSEGSTEVIFAHIAGIVNEGRSEVELRSTDSRGRLPPPGMMLATADSFVYFHKLFCHN